MSKVFGDGPRRTEALRDISLEVPRGRFTTLIGPSGCGKSTLLRVVAGLTGADEGSVSIFGEGVAVARRAKHIGYVPQSPALLPWRSVLGNVRFPLEVNRRAPRAGPSRLPEAILEAMGLGAVLQRRPEELSGGMQQRVAIARAFAFDPALLLMDEPFSALDELTREALRHQLLALWQEDQKTVLFVTHSVTEAVVLSDDVVVLSARPGSVHAVIPIPLARGASAREEGSEPVQALERAVRAALREASLAVAP